jgi:hypothetical protein
MLGGKKEAQVCLLVISSVIISKKLYLRQSFNWNVKRLLIF